MIVVFWIASIVAIVSTVMVITRRNAIHALLYLIVSLLSAAVIFLVLGAPFVAMLEVIVYAGAIMVLFLFVIMLLNLGSPQPSDLRRGLGRVLAGSVAVALVAIFARLLMAGGDVEGLGGSSALDPLLESSGAVAAVAEPLFTRYLVAFEVTSILLVVAIVGAVVLARRHAP